MNLSSCHLLSHLYIYTHARGQPDLVMIRYASKILVMEKLGRALPFSALQLV